MRKYRVLGLLVAFVVVGGICGVALAPPQGKGGGKPGGGGDGGDGGGGGGAPADPAIVFVSSPGLVVMNSDGSRPTTLLSNSVQSPAWSPDLDGDPSNGYQGAITFRDVTSAGAGRLFLLDVRVMSGTSTGLRLRAVSPTSAHFPAWSPDLDPTTPGYQGGLVWSENYGIEWIDISWDGNVADPSTVHSPTPQMLVENPIPGIVFNWYPSWSPDGTQLVFVATSIHSPSFLYELIVHDIITGENRTLVGPTTTRIYDPQWSRTSGVVAMSIGNVLHMIDVSDPQPVPISLGTAGFEPAWAPDDSALVYSAVVGTGNATRKIVHLNLASGVTTVLATDKKLNYVTPDWRPAE